MLLYHGSCVEWLGAGILICGAPGSGKSDLCLRLTEAGANLVADDQVLLYQTDKGVMAKCPERIRGLMEIRGIGIIEMPFIEHTTIRLKVSLQPSEEIDRMPENQTELIENIQIPVLKLDASLASAPLKIKTYLLIQDGKRKLVS